MIGLYARFTTARIEGNRLVQFSLILQDDAEIAIGVGVVRLQVDGPLTKWIIASSSWPCSRRALPRLLYASAKSGLWRRASR